MKLLTLFTALNIQTIVEQFNEHHPDHSITVDNYRNDFLSQIMTKTLVQTGNTVEVSHYRWEHDDPEFDQERITIRLIADNDEFGITFEPWNELLACDVVCDIHFDFPLERVAAEIFWELTWRGSEEDSIATVDFIDDRLEALERETEAAEFSADTPTPLADSSSLNHVLDTLLEDFSPEERRELEDEAKRRVASMKTMRVYKNGVLQEKKHD